MKTKILQLALLALFMLPVRAFCFGDAAINIRNHDNDLITVMLDGVQYPNAVNEFHLSGITAGRHYVKVFTCENFGWNYSNFSHLAFNGAVNLQCGEEIFAVIDEFNQLRIKKVVNQMSVRPAVTSVRSQLQCNTSYNNSYNNSCNTSYNNNYYPTDHCNQPVYSYGPVAMNEGSFCALKQSIADKWFDSSKLELAEFAMKNNYFTTQQVAAILNLFDFESTKLEYAKKAFAHTVDQQNYWLVNDAFSFSSSISDLQHFIGY